MPAHKMNTRLSLLLLLTTLELSVVVMAADSVLPNSIAPSIEEQRFVKLGGIDQWITVRSSNRDNPVLLVVHGGPGDAQSSLRCTYAIYEKDFKIVSVGSARRRQNLRKES